MKARILKFEGQTREGYSEVEEEDSQMAAERGESSRKTKRLYKVKSLTGTVRVAVDFAEVRESRDARSGIAESEDSVSVESRDSAGQLPPKLRFLEKVANEAFRQFFDRYN